MINVDATGFRNALMDFIDHVEIDVSLVIRKACIDLFAAIASRTPVDTGRLKSNWQLDTSYNSSVIGDDGQVFTGAEIEQAIQNQTSGFDITINNDKVEIFNNVKYAEYNEAGHSQQAPAGMVAVSLSEFEEYFNRAVMEIRASGGVV